MEHTQVSARLVELLGLETAPVALAFAAEPPAAVASATKPVPSACSFWREAERGVFYASAEQHLNCPLGAMVMGFDLPAEVGEQLGGLVESMCEQHYLTADEPAKVPTVQRNSSGIIYGPLADFPVRPDLVLLWPNSQQAMIFTEAAGGANWTEAPMQVSGRPGCAALPLALANDRPRLSLGCMGMRTFTSVADDRVLGVVPGSQAEEFVTALERTVGANATMKAYYEGRAAAFS